jgi:hypothetical protein
MHGVLKDRSAEGIGFLVNGFQNQEEDLAFSDLRPRLDPSGYRLSGLQVQRRWNTYVVFVCGRIMGRMGRACIKLLWKERKAVDCNNHPTCAGKMISISL